MIADTTRSVSAVSRIIRSRHAPPSLPERTGCASPLVWTRLTGPVRVVSLVPSMSETLLAWGITPVAVTRFCEHPDDRGGGRHEGSGRVGDRRPATRPRRGRRRGESQGGSRRARL